MSGGWEVTEDVNRAVHVVPVADLIDHNLRDECPCGPTGEHVPNPDGPDGWLVTHHSLDGREQHEC